MGKVATALLLAALLIAMALMLVQALHLDRLFAKVFS